MFDQANGSSIFLDEIGDLTLPVQTNLLRVPQNKEIRPLGANRSYLVDTRILAATNQDLEQKITQNRFREDLFYRLNVATLTLPSLDTIREDIPLLVAHFLDRVAREQEKAIESFTQEYPNQLLGRTAGNVSAAAQLSGMKRQSLQKIIKRYGIDVQQLRS